MKSLAGVLVAVLLVMAAGCATVSVTYDYDPEADFSGLKTYDWIPIPKKSKAKAFVIKRIRSAVTTELTAKGFSNTSEKPDFLVALHGGTEKKVDVQEWGYTYGSGSYYRYPGYRSGGYGAPYDAPFGHRGYLGPPGGEIVESRSGTDVYEYEEGTLVIDIVNAEKKELLWRGSASQVIDPYATPEERTKNINEIVGQILAQFPPVPGEK